MSRAFLPPLIAAILLVLPVAALAWTPVAVTRADGGDVNGAMVVEGMAWVYPRYCRAACCGQWKLSENSARAARRGLWRDKNPMPPWQWWRKGIWRE